MEKTKHIQNIVLLLTLIAVTSVLVIETSALPGGVTINYQYNETSDGDAPETRNDTGGYIYVTNFDTTQQDSNWKAYVGNITGSFILQNSEGQAIYDWGASEVTAGEIYVSRNDSIYWSAINCSNATTLASEDAYFGFSQGKSDSVNSTFNITTHKAMTVGTVTIPVSECYATQLFVNNSRQEVTVDAFWQQILLQDNLDHIVYATRIENNKYGYNNITYDFQIIVPENGSYASNTLYYFWAEI